MHLLWHFRSLSACLANPHDLWVYLLDLRSMDKSTTFFLGNEMTDEMTKNCKFAICAGWRDSPTSLHMGHFISPT